jgi:hypothetical protein
VLSWNEQELKSGKILKIKKFPGAQKVKLFRVTVSTDRTDFFATNDLSQDSTDVVQKVCKVRWKVEELPFGKASPTSRIKAIDWD